MTAFEQALAEIEGGPSGPRIGAFFDFDGTLIAGYSATAFAEEQIRRLQVTPAQVAELLRARLEVRLGRAEEEDLVLAAIRSFAGYPESEVVELGERLFARRIAGSVHPEARELVRAHQRKGHLVVIASSATRYQAGPLARDLGVEQLLCTELEVVDGLLTGAVKGRLLWGPGKAAAVRRFASRKRLDLQRSYGYGNGDEDAAFLEVVGNPRPVNPRSRLAAVAAERGWPVLRFRSRERPDPLLLARNATALYAMGAATAAGFGVGLLVNRSRREAANLVTSLAPELGLALAGVRLTVIGEEHLWSDRPAVFIYNHQSYLDPLIVARLLQRDFTAIAKMEISRWPVLGGLARLAEIAFVERGNTAQARRVLDPVADKLRQGLSVMIAPEGTRSPTRKLGPFKKGAFHIAMQAGVPLVPIVIRNSSDLLAKTSFVTRPGSVDVAVLPPIRTAGWTAATLDRHVAEVRQLFLATLESWPPRARRRQPATRSRARSSA